jgi:hypothetical protein
VGGGGVGSGGGVGGGCHSDGDADDLSSHTREEKYFNFLQFGAFLSYDDFFVFVM